MDVLTSFLNRVTMYRLMLYELIVMVAAASALSVLGILPYNPGGMLLQAASFIAVCWGINALCARARRVPVNTESSLITGLILTGIMGPLTLPNDWLVLLVAAGAAMVSKYVVVYRHSHILNPAAAGAIVSALLLGHPASWWIGTATLLPVIAVGGLLVLQKLRYWHLVGSFAAVYLPLLVLYALGQGMSLTETAQHLSAFVITSPVLFFAGVMLIEPLTAPRTHRRRILFGAAVALILFGMQHAFPTVPYSLELSLLIGNVLARIINPDFRQAFILRRKESVGPSIINFWFEPAWRFSFLPGQFLEYTHVHPRADQRGVRRYFTMASSPTEAQVLLSARMAKPGSTFKQALQKLSPGETVTASKVAGDFVLPSDPAQKLAFVAGGIGITPFRSMVKYLLDTHQARDIVLLYAARQEADLVFRDVFEEAKAAFGLRPIYVLSDHGAAPAQAAGKQDRAQIKSGMIDAALLQETVPDWRTRRWYISGPEPMVQSVVKALQGIGVPRLHIKRDFFPGYPA